MKWNRIRILSVAVGLVAVVALVYAAGPAMQRPGGPGRLEERFAQADADGNGAISKTEFSEAGPKEKGPRHEELFALLDRNKDGEIQKAELAQMREEREAKHREVFKTADQNGDGKLSRDEFRAMGAEKQREHSPIERMDKNGDGLIQKSELPEPREEGKGHRPPEEMKGQDMPPPPPPQGEGRDDHPRPMMGHNPEEWFTACDTNGDGALDQSELDAQHAKMREQAFDRMDENSDGFLDSDEFKPPMGGPGMGRHEMDREKGKDGDTGSADVGLAMASSSSTPLTAPDRYLLADNYPNPFNGSTTIRYDLPEAGDVSLAVYNLSGELVKTLVDERQASGHYQVELRMADQTSGMYFYRLNVNGFSGVNRMAYIK